MANLLNDSDAALDIMSTLIQAKTQQLEKETDNGLKAALKDEIKSLYDEMNVLYSDGPKKDKLMEKVFEKYAPLIK
jgi:hypothetical protein